MTIRRLPLTALPMLGLIVALLLQGCAGGFGPSTVEPARFNYNQAIQRSIHEQMLINIVRQRYNEAPYFLGIGTVVAQYSLNAHVGSSGSVGNASQYSVGGAGGLAFSESPTITYRPLEDAEFAERMLRPIAPSILVLLSHSGWMLEDLMQLSVQRINQLNNIPIANTPHPDSLARYTAFKEVTSLFRELQDFGAIGQKVHKGDDQELEYVIYFEEDDHPATQERIKEAKALLRLDPAQNAFNVVSSTATPAPNQLVFETRSIQGIISFLSRGVDIPAADYDRVAHAPLSDELEADFAALYGDSFKVHSSLRRPDNAFVAVRHRNHWFYIDDRDIKSKNTFTIMLYLFSVQAIGADKGGDLLLTLPTG